MAQTANQRSEADMDSLSQVPGQHAGRLHASNGAEESQSPTPYKRSSLDQEGAATVTHSLEEEVLVVDWDGLDDPDDPKNWAFRQKWAATIIVSLFTFVSPLSSAMIAPASPNLGNDVGIQSPTILALSVSIFILGYAIGPLIIGPLSEIFGRCVVLQCSNLFFLAWNTGCGFAQTKGQLLAFRLLSGIGGSAPLSIGGGVIGDIWRAEERGQAISIYSLAPILGPVLGPVLGSWVAERASWRWVFWSTSIFDVVIQGLGLFFLRESYAPVLLEKKAKLIRKNLQQDTEKGAPRQIRTVFETGAARSWSAIFSKALIRPFAIFFGEPIIQLLGLFMAFVYGTLYLFLTTIPSIFEGLYHQPTGLAGLHYIALGIGLTGASQINARVLDKLYVYLKDKNGGVHKPEFRVPPVIPASILLPAGLLITGWTAQYQVHWIAPDIGLVLVGAGIILTYQFVQTYVIDAFTLHAASALAAVSCLRSLAGFGFPLLGPAMYNALGFGKGNTILAAAAILFGCPTPWLLWNYGEKIRMKSRYATKK